MTKHHRPQPKYVTHQQAAPKFVNSLLDHMQDGNEYGSIVSLVTSPNVDLVAEIAKGIAEIEAVRKRPCISYIGNVVAADGECGIDQKDDLPFHEMIAQIPGNEKKVDVFVTTIGGSAHQVSRFVNALRPRFDEVDFLLPSYCMSAGTIFALSGDRIWMTPRACLGPIDPQVPSKDGRYVPAQALLLLVQELQKQGEEAMKKGLPVPWSAVRTIDSLDKKELADTMSASQYSIVMAAEFLTNYKFKNWTTHSNGSAVTPEDKEKTAQEIASALASHDRWKSHGHAITRELLLKEVRLRIDRPEDVDGLERAMKRLWALCNWIFDRTPITKAVVSPKYRFVRQRAQQH